MYVRNEICISDIHRVCPYSCPQIRLVNLDTDDLLGIIETSGATGPSVHEDPEDPDPGTELTNPNSVWEHPYL